MSDTPPPVIRITEQEALNAAAGWLPIATEPDKLCQQFLVTNDPTDHACALLVTRSPYGKHYDGDFSLEDFYGVIPTHWMPVAAKAVA
jgi:hypothetical protein